MFLLLWNLFILVRDIYHSQNCLIEDILDKMAKNRFNCILHYGLSFKKLYIILPILYWSEYILMRSVQWYSYQLVRPKNMPVMLSSLEWNVPSYVGLTILLCVISKSLKSKPHTSWYYRQALTDNGYCAKEEEEEYILILLRLR